MLIKSILKTKGTEVHSIASTATLAEAVESLVDHNVGSLVVFDGEAMAGIITERDILRACRGGADLKQLVVQDHMTSPVITGSLEDPIADVMGLLTDRRIRHLPIIEDGELVGIVSIGDVVKAQHDRLTMENHYLKDYLQHP